jgi:hypothetical protein
VTIYRSTTSYIGGRIKEAKLPRLWDRIVVSAARRCHGRNERG